MSARVKSIKNISQRKRWLFRLLAIFIGLLPLLIIEAGLRFADLPQTPASDDPLVDLHQLKPLFVRSADGERWEIPESRYNFFRPESFAIEKGPNDFRIFALGGSTVQGRPFAIETAFSAWLELALNTVDDSRQYDVINCGGISYASYRLAPILDEVIQYKPDLIILYTGHNEFLEERTYKDLKNLPRGLAQVSRALGSLRTTQALRQYLSSSSDDASEEKWIASPEVNARLDVAGGLADYHRDPKWRNDVIEHFESTVERMLDRCDRANIPVIVCVPASDLIDTPPFKIEVAPGLSPEQQATIDHAWKLATQPELNSETRIKACQQITDLDPRHAGASFILGRLLYEQRQFEQAKRWLVVARDWDVCPLRAPSEIQDAVSLLSERQNVRCLNISEKLDELDPHGLPGSRVFVDHVHPSIETHQKVAKWLMIEMFEMGLISTELPTDSQIQKAYGDHLANLGEEYFLRGQQRLEGLRQWAAGRAGELSID